MLGAILHTDFILYENYPLFNGVMSIRSKLWTIKVFNKHQGTIIFHKWKWFDVGALCQYNQTEVLLNNVNTTRNLQDINVWKFVIGVVAADVQEAKLDE